MLFQILIAWLVTTVSLFILDKLPLGVEIDSFNKALIDPAVFGILNPGASSPRCLGLSHNLDNLWPIHNSSERHYLWLIRLSSRRLDCCAGEFGSQCLAQSHSALLTLRSLISYMQGN